MDKNQKFLKKLSSKELLALQSVLHKIQSKKTDGLDIKKLTGHTDVFRVRVGTIRVIFLANRSVIEILEISRRSEKTYHNF
ncbi:type II toxin-antitoxin system RelE/ParE family toxin [Patescibacteria group bacterium]|nr:type II toxin-antitoxin system RelE/ParE family toxin [Patescibacteria group bacterium]